MVCAAFDVSRSSYYDYRQRRGRIDVERLALKAKVNRLFSKSRSSAGSRTMVGLLSEEGIAAGRFKVRRLMSELGLICKQPGPHAYKQATVERIDIPNHLAREFVVDQPDQVWCGDITYVWTGQAWSYLAVVLDLYARRVVGWAMSASPWDLDGQESILLYGDDITRHHRMALELQAEQEKGLQAEGFMGKTMDFVRSSGMNKDQQMILLDQLTGGGMRKKDIMSMINSDQFDSDLLGMNAGQATDLKMDFKQIALDVSSPLAAKSKYLQEATEDIKSMLGSLAGDIAKELGDLIKNIF